MRRFVAGTLALLALLSLASCGGKKSKSNCGPTCPVGVVEVKKTTPQLPSYFA